LEYSKKKVKTDRDVFVSLVVDKKTFKFQLQLRRSCVLRVYKYSIIIIITMVTTNIIIIIIITIGNNSSNKATTTYSSYYEYEAFFFSYACHEP